MVQAISLDTRTRFLQQKRAAIYIRVSGRTQAEKGSSLQSQLQGCREHALSQGYLIDEARIFREVHTAVEYYERPEMMRMREAAKRREFDAVIVYAYDRLARKQIHQAIIIDSLQQQGITVESVTEPQIDDTAVGQFLRNTFGFVAEIEREKTLERTQRGIRNERVAKGRLMGSARPLYGFQWDNPDPKQKNRYVEDEQEIAVVKRAFLMCYEGMTNRAIAAVFTREGIPTPNGKKVWLAETVGRILRNPFYAGRAVAFKYKVERLNGKRHVTRRVAEEQVPLPEGTVPSVIDPDIFDGVQKRMQRNKQEALRNRKNHPDCLLRNGLAICGYCGGSMTVRYENEHKIFYRCSRATKDPNRCPAGKISVKLLDEAVWQHIVAIIKNPKLVAQRIEQLKIENPTSEELTYITKRLPQIEEELENLVDIGQKAKSVSVRDRIEANISQLEEEQKQLLERQQALLPVEINYEEEQQKLAEFARWCANAEKELPHATFAKKLEACKNFHIKALVWRRDEATNQPVFEIRDQPLAVVSQTP